VQRGMLWPVLALRRWLQVVAAFRALSGKLSRYHAGWLLAYQGLKMLSCRSLGCSIRDICLHNCSPTTLLMPNNAVVIGIFFPHKFKTTLINRRPDLGTKC
jgi:hypothetical protein